jgi:predicted kinase
MDIIRIELAPNDGAKKPKGKHASLINKNVSYSELCLFASAKVRTNKKKTRLFVCKNSNAIPGTEIVSDSNLDDILEDGILLIVSNGENYKGPGKKEAINAKITPPPRFPFPGQICIDECDNISDHMDNDNDNKKVQIEINMGTEYDIELDSYPIFEGNVLNQIRKAIKGNDKFIEKDCGQYIAFDYTDNAEFPEVQSVNDAILRECRGLIVSPNTGRILARRFEKFFNVNQRPETRIDNIDFTGAKYSDKIDGSLASPVLLDNFSLIWATKKDISSSLTKYIRHHPHKDMYNHFVISLLKTGCTPIFEWCEKSKVVGVIEHIDDKLILLTVRNNVTGEYMDIDTMDIPEKVVKVQYKLLESTFKKLNGKVMNMVGKEGVVIFLPNGKRYKLKSKWYVRVAHANLVGGNESFLPQYLESEASLKNIPEYKIWMCAIMNHDDIVSQVASLLGAIECQKFMLFIESIMREIKLLQKDLIVWGKYAITKYDRHDIINYTKSLGWREDIIKGTLNGIDIFDKLRSFLHELARKRDLHTIKNLIDIDWNSTYSTFELTPYKTEKCPDNIQDHVLVHYLKRKISNLIGTTVSEKTDVSIPRMYKGNEGKIKGMWEKFTKYEVWDLRVDLQPPRNKYDEHNGDMDYALFLIQYGLMGNPDNKPHGCYGGVLVPTNHEFMFEQISDAFIESFKSECIVKMKRVVNDKKVIYCDLDGVLVDFVSGVFELTGRLPENQGIDKMWQRIKTYPMFWDQLKWMPDGEQLWNQIKKYKPIILTGIPKDSRKNVERGKKEWVKKHLGEDVNVIVCYSCEKYKYSGKNHILIDDRYKLKENWEKFGGKFIHYSTNGRAFYELSKSMGDVQKNVIKHNEEPKVYVHNKYAYCVDSIPVVKDGDIIAIDSEWVIGSKDKINVFQICHGKIAYIIDMMTHHDNYLQIRKILSNNKILKIGYGIEKEEMERIGCIVINNYIDIQEAVTDHFELGCNGLPSLSLVAKTILNRLLHKTKDMHMGWDRRPLDHENITYAVNDVSVLLDLYYLIKVPGKTLEHQTTGIKKAFKNKEFDIEQTVRVRYSGIFLDDSSKELIKERYPPIHKKVYCDHITLLYNPTEYDIRGIGIGEAKHIEVIGYYVDDKIQALKVMHNEHECHITISVNNCDPKDCMSIKDWDIDIDKFIVIGNIGIMIEPYTDPLSILPQRVQDKIKKFEKEAEVGETCKFTSQELSPRERSIVHEYVKSMGNNMISQSTGKGINRKLLLSMRKKIIDFDRFIAIDQTTNTKCIVDQSVASMLTIVSDNTLLRTIGRITEDGIDANISLKNKTMYIMRGLPGSGKSSMASMLQALTNAKICSADHYFIMDGEYKFNRDNLEKAHRFCFKTAEEAIKEGKSVIIDNTNVTLDVYMKYKELANDALFNCIILEIYCKDKDMAVKFAKRNKHTVPIRDVMLMLSRWETDDDVLLLQPYVGDKVNNQEINTINTGSFEKWLLDKGFIHNNKQRRRTHLIMEIAQKPVMFLDVPKSYYDEFWARYASSDEKKYISEQPITDEKFKMFFDIDFLKDGDIDPIILATLYKLIRQKVSGKILISSCESTKFYELTKVGYHINCYNHHVNYEEANDIIKSIIDELNHGKFANSGYDWNKVIDSGVYRSGLRMIGSNKPTKGIDKGRIYEVIGIINEDGNFEPSNGIEMANQLKYCSIHM